MEQFHWLLWVDSEIRGYSDSLEDAYFNLEKISSELVDKIKKEHTVWNVSIKRLTKDHLQINCVHPGYVYNSSWVAHNIHCTRNEKLSPLTKRAKKRRNRRARKDQI